jgi:hypothetical protein
VRGTRLNFKKEQWMISSRPFDITSVILKKD